MITGNTGVALTASGAASTITLEGAINTGATGAVTIAAAKSITPAVNTIDAEAGSDISGGKSVTLTATKGSVEVDSIGGTRAPATISITALNNIENDSTLKATTSITEKATTATQSSAITVNGSMLIPAGGSKPTGAITLSDASSQGSIDSSNVDLSATKSVTVTAAKGDVTVGSIGGQPATAPATVALTAFNNITNTGAITATTTVTEKTTSPTAVAGASLININGNIIASGPSGVVTITSAASGVSNGINAQSIYDISGVKSVTVTGAKDAVTVGSIGTEATSGIVKVTSFDGLTETGSIDGGTSVALLQTSAAAGFLTINNINAASGAVSAIASFGALTVSPAAIIGATSTSKVKATITLENNASTAANPGTILIGSGASIITGGSSGGNVNIVIGKVPSKPVNGTPPPANVMLVGASGIFFGTTPAKAPSTANGSTSTLTSINASLIFNTGALLPAAITLQGGNIITADPPSAPPTAAAISQARSELTNTLGYSPAQSQINFSQAPQPGIAATGSGAQYAGPSAGINIGSVLAPGINPSVSTNINANGSATSGLQSSIVESTMSSPSLTTDHTPSLIQGHTLYGAASEYGVATESTYIGSGGSPVGEIEATLVTGADLGIDGAAINDIEMAGWTSANSQTGANSKTMQLRKGNVVIAPDQDTVIETSFGRVAVSAKSVALIMALPTGTSCIRSGRHSQRCRRNNHRSTKHVTLAPGRQAMITSHLVEGFEMINPAESFSYRNLTSKKLDCDLQAFTSEFSMTDAIGNVKQLKSLVSSRHPEAKRLANHLIKTAAIVSQLGGGGEAYLSSITIRASRPWPAVRPGNFKGG